MLASYLENDYLAPGGMLVVLAMAVDDNGDFGYGPVVDAIYSALVEMADCGFLSPEELQQMVIPTVGRSRTDFLAPFGASGCFNGLCIEEIEIFYGEDHIWPDFEHHRDPLAFAAQWAAFSRASVFPTLAGSLDSGGTTPRASDFMKRLETGMITRLAAKPQPMRIPLGRLLLAKKTSQQYERRLETEPRTSVSGLYMLKNRGAIHASKRFSQHSSGSGGDIQRQTCRRRR